MVASFFAVVSHAPPIAVWADRIGILTIHKVRVQAMPCACGAMYIIHRAQPIIGVLIHVQVFAFHLDHRALGQRHQTVISLQW